MAPHTKHDGRPIWSRETAELHMLEWDAAQRRQIQKSGRNMYWALVTLFMLSMGVAFALCWLAHNQLWVAE